MEQPFSSVAPPREFAPCLTLIGMAGVGKTTIGNTLAQTLQWAFLDTDHIIESLYGAPLQAVTDELSKEAFLDLEGSVLSQLRLQRTVIATGGSAVYRDAAMQALQRLGPIVYLEAPLSVIEERIARNPQRGLAIGPGQTIADIFYEREALYKHYASLRCDTYGYSPQQCARWIVTQLGKKHPAFSAMATRADG